ncbi:MAG: hypothetical protein J0H20_05340 [Rhizobiales bacterium]|nr:hypothetical protein [Hyphomicrobiales bacterium]
MQGQRAGVLQLQDDLGRQNDARRSPELLGRLADAELSPAANRALGVLLGQEAFGRVEAEAALRRDWAAFRRRFAVGRKQGKRRR